MTDPRPTTDAEAIERCLAYLKSEPLASSLNATLPSGCEVVIWENGNVKVIGTGP